jgi:NADP-dependent 3-hydroxy acid dehydrogenase YdfG
MMNDSMTLNTTVDATPLSGRSIVLTGGTTGIGRATARLLASRGARVLIFGRHEKELNEALEEIRDMGGEVYGLTADQSREDDIRKVFREADERLGGVNVLINNAALAAGSITEGDYSDWQYVINTNLLGYMACCREAIDRMRPKGDGHILLVGSMSADEREEGKDVYVATKAAIQGFTQALRKSVNKEGIRVTLVEPGKVASDMSGPKEEQPRKESRMEMLKAEDIAECVYYCLVQPKRCDVVSVQIRPLMQLI